MRRLVSSEARSGVALSISCQEGHWAMALRLTRLPHHAHTAGQEGDDECGKASCDQHKAKRHSPLAGFFCGAAGPISHGREHIRLFGKKTGRRRHVGERRPKSTARRWGAENSRLKSSSNRSRHYCDGPEAAGATIVAVALYRHRRARRVARARSIAGQGARRCARTSCGRRPCPSSCRTRPCAGQGHPPAQHQASGAIIGHQRRAGRRCAPVSSFWPADIPANSDAIRPGIPI